uniref:Glutathione S-transferase 3, mitochondrial n=1 Tax=Araucaria cunninghamii TaxID=56994 RepID=A0A0D6R2N6_ARACU
MALDLPPGYGWVVLIAVAYCFLNVWMARQVGNARKRYKVPYPTLYAIESENKDAKLFNCVQRGHQNSLEMMPMFFMLLVLGGLQHPIASSVLGVVYCLGRYAYFTGYATGDPKNRLTYGRFNFLALLGLMVCTLSLAWELLRNVPKQE